MNEIPKVCDYHGRDNEPCYGKIDEFYDGNNWITFCEGHQAVPDGGAYVPKDPIRRIIFSQQNKTIRAMQKEIEMLRAQVDYANLRARIEPGDLEIEIPPERLEILFS